MLVAERDRLSAGTDHLEVDLVALSGGRTIGNIMYTGSWLLDEDDAMLETVTFGPPSVLPEFRLGGVGAALVERSIARAREMGYAAAIIMGDPGTYRRFGFRPCGDLGVAVASGGHPRALLVLELEAGVLEGRRWRYEESSAFRADAAAAADAIAVEAPPRPAA